jgi:IclR family acetate operon transcriptional repressor
MPADEAIERVLQQGGFDHADRYGPNAIRSTDALLGELKTTARRGYGVAINEAEPGVTAIAAVIREGAAHDAKSRAVGTVSIAGPSARIDDDRIRTLASKVMQCASELSSLWPVRRRSPAVKTPAAPPAPRGSGSPARPR